MSSRPNLFDYAPSELSQDAFLLWLANFADPQQAVDDAALNQLGQRFVRSLLDKAGVAVSEIRSVRTKKQVSHVDVAIVVNEEVGLIIEDKTVTRDHDDQLTRYLESTIAAQLNVSHDQLHGIYLKTGNEPGGREWPPRWSSYMRDDLLGAIGHGVESGSDIARDFIEHLRRIDQDTEAFRSSDFLNSDAKWTNPRGIEGFYQWLEGEVPGSAISWSDWGYVPNAMGGFYGFWAGAGWALPEIPQLQVYLQIHDGCSAFARMSRPDGGRVEVSDLRNALQILQRQSTGIGVSWQKEGMRHRSGNSANVARLWFGDDQNFAVYTSEGAFDEAGTTERLRLVWQDLTARSSAVRA